MSIATELTRIQQAKADIKTAIEAKGVTVPSSATIDTYDDYVSQISGGGGGVQMPSKLSAIELSNYGVITSATIKSGETTIPSYAFENCASLTSVTIPDTVTSIGTSFNNCTSLTNVTIGSGVTYIGDAAFQNCSSLPTINLPSGLTHIGNAAFSSCGFLGSITIPSGITEISEFLLNNCYSLTSVTIPDSVTSIGYSAFNNCGSLPSINLPSGVTYIGSWAFAYCGSLTSITVLATTPPTLGEDSVFEETNDAPIYVPSESVEVYKSASGWSTYADRIQAISSGQNEQDPSPGYDDFFD